MWFKRKYKTRAHNYFHFLPIAQFFPFVCTRITVWLLFASAHRSSYWSWTVVSNYTQNIYCRISWCHSELNLRPPVRYICVKCYPNYHIHSWVTAKITEAKLEYFPRGVLEISHWLDMKTQTHYNVRKYSKKCRSDFHTDEREVQMFWSEQKSKTLCAF